MERKEIIKIFAENLRAERARKRYSQEVLAEKAGITPEYLARLETEKYNPTLVVVIKLAIVLEIDIDRLVTLDVIKKMIQ